VAGIDHLAIRVTDMQRSGAFYAKLFGPQVKKPPRAIVANPGSVPSPHYWVRLGESYLALSLASPENGPPAFDHPCITFAGIEADAMARRLAPLGRRFERPASYSIATDFWVVDPAGNLVQIDADPEGYWHRLDALAGAVPAEEIDALHAPPAFRTLRIDRIALRASDLEASADYYRKLLGSEARTSARERFRLGASSLILGPATSEEFFVIAVADFERAEVARTLREMGVDGVVERIDEDVVELRDPDGLKLQIGGTPPPTEGPQLKKAE
jgi:catechol 2,3-dioxygenase-like lactoylglutathione lyase family enzyme